MIQEVGIVTPLYATKDNDRLKYLRDTTASILKQDYDFSWIVVDDGSTDSNTIDFLHTIRDPRFVLLKREREKGDLESSANGINHGFSYLYSNGCQFFSYVHSDDLLSETSLERRVVKLKEGNDMVYGRTAFFNDKKKAVFEQGIPYSDNAGFSIMESGFPHHSSMWSRNMIQLMIEGRGGAIFDSSLKGKEDLDVTLYSRKILIQNPDLTVGYVNAVLYIYIKQPKSISGPKSTRTHIREVDLVYRKNGFAELTKKPEWKTHIERPCFWLPEPIKAHLRKFKPLVNRVSKGRCFPNISRVKSRIDPYWFRND